MAVLLAAPPPVVAQETGTSPAAKFSLTLSDGFPRSHLDDGKLTSSVSVGELAEALVVGNGAGSPTVQAVCAAAAVVGNRNYVHVSRSFTVRRGQSAPAGKHCTPSISPFIPGNQYIPGNLYTPGDQVEP